MIAFFPRLAIISFGACVLGGCSVVKHQVTDPYVAARFDSSKNAADFAKCAADSLGEDFQLSSTGLSHVLTRQRGILVQARWDFFPTNNGSQAELRSSTPDDAGVEAVRGCI